MGCLGAAADIYLKNCSRNMIRNINDKLRSVLRHAYQIPIVGMS